MTSFERHRMEGPNGPSDFMLGGEGPPLVCLHPSSGVRINPATTMLAERRLVYLPVAPGFDDAPEVDGLKSVADLADWFAEFIEARFDHAIDLCGHSFGGWAACWLAARHPHLVRRLVLQCPAGLNPRTGEALEGDPATFLARAFAHPEKRPPETKTAETVAANRARSKAYADGVANDLALIARLGDIVCPTLILYGLKDGVVPPETAEVLDRNIPRARLVKIEDAAHNIEIDQPEIYVEAVLSFLAEA